MHVVEVLAECTKKRGTRDFIRSQIPFLLSPNQCTETKSVLHASAVIQQEEKTWVFRDVWVFSGIPWY